VEKTPFAHVDMAGPVWNSNAGEATGFGPSLITHFVEGFSKEE
jgi:leucyl aminopeptidase